MKTISNKCCWGPHGCKITQQYLPRLLQKGGVTTKVFVQQLPDSCIPPPLPLAHIIHILFINIIHTLNLMGILVLGWSQGAIRCALHFPHHQKMQSWEYPVIIQPPLLPITPWQDLSHQNNSRRMPVCGKYFPWPPPPLGTHPGSSTTWIWCIYIH